MVERHGVDSVVHFAGYKAAGESMEVPERYFDNNVARTGRLLDVLSGAAWPGSCSRRRAASTDRPSTLPGRRGARHRAREPLRREQAPGGADVALVRRVPRHALGVAALLQRRRRLLRRPHRRGLAQARSTSSRSRCSRRWARSPRCRCTAPTTTPPTARASATTSTSTTSPTRTCARCATSRAAVATCSLNVGTGRGSSVLEVVEGAKAVSGIDFPVQLAPRRPGDPSAVWADNTREVLGWEAHHDLDAILSARGRGTRATPTATRPALSLPTAWRNPRVRRPPRTRQGSPMDSSSG